MLFELEPRKFHAQVLLMKMLVHMFQLVRLWVLCNICNYTRWCKLVSHDFLGQFMHKQCILIWVYRMGYLFNPKISAIYYNYFEKTNNWDTVHKECIQCPFVAMFEVRFYWSVNLVNIWVFPFQMFEFIFVLGIKELKRLVYVSLRFWIVFSLIIFSSFQFI